MTEIDRLLDEQHDTLSARLAEAVIDVVIDAVALRQEWDAGALLRELIEVFERNGVPVSRECLEMARQHMGQGFRDIEELNGSKVFDLEHGCSVDQLYASGLAEQRQQRIDRIHASRPWERSTGPRTAEGKARSGQNARKIQLTPGMALFYAHRDHPKIIGYLADNAVPIAERLGYVAGDIIELARSDEDGSAFLEELAELIRLAGENVTEHDIAEARRILVEEY